MSYFAVAPADLAQEVAASDELKLHEEPVVILERTYCLDQKRTRRFLRQLKVQRLLPYNMLCVLKVLNSVLVNDLQSKRLIRRWHLSPLDKLLDKLIIRAFTLIGITTITRVVCVFLIPDRQVHKAKVAFANVEPNVEV